MPDSQEEIFNRFKIAITEKCPRILMIGDSM